MAVTAVTTGLVTSWAGTQNTALIQSASGPYEFTLNMEAPTEDVTPFNGSGVTFTSNIPNIRSWSGSITTRFTTALIGSSGLVTFGSGYTANTRAWTLDLTNDAKDTTVFNGSGVTYRTFVPGLLSWGGTYETYVDNTTALVFPGASAASATFKLVEDGATDRTLAGNIIASSVPVTVQVGELPTATFTYVGSGTLTAAGSANFFPSGAIVAPETGSLVLQSYTSRTYTGDAFFTSVSISCAVDGVITATINFQGTGALTIA